MVRGAWRATVRGAAKESDTTLQINNKNSLSGIVWKHAAMSRFQNSSLFFLKEWDGHTIHLRIPKDS